MPAPSEKTIDELAELSPTIAQLRERYRDEWETEMAKPNVTPPQPRPWAGGLRPNRKSGSGNRKTTPSRAQTHLAMTLQYTQRDKD